MFHCSLRSGQFKGSKKYWSPQKVGTEFRGYANINFFLLRILAKIIRTFTRLFPGILSPRYRRAILWFFFMFMMYEYLLCVLFFLLFRTSRSGLDASRRPRISLNEENAQNWTSLCNVTRSSSLLIRETSRKEAGHL